MAAPTGPVVKDDGRPNGPETPDGIGTPITPAPAPDAQPQVAKPPETSPEFQSWLSGGGGQGAITPGAAPAPYAQPAQPARGPVLPADTDPELMQWLGGQIATLRQDIGTTLDRDRTQANEARVRDEMWATFQARFPEFVGEDNFIAGVYNDLVSQELGVPPTANLRDQLLDTVYHTAVDRRRQLLEKGGYQLEDEDVNRTAGIEAGTSSAPAGPSAPKETEDEATLASDLVVMQGKTEFFPEVGPDVLKLYGKNSGISR